MSSDGYYNGTTTAAAAGRQRRRREICRSFTCISPWFIFSRRSSGGKSRVSRNRFSDKFGGTLDLQRKNEIIKRGSTNHEASASSIEDVSAESGKEASFNLGVGLGVIYVVRNELSKMVELRNRIESLLQDYQNQDKNSLSMPSKSRISCSSFSNASVVESIAPEKHDSDQHFSSENIAHSEISFGNRRYRREKSLKMDQMEVEFEAELYHLQQLQMDAESFSNCSEQQFSMVNVEDSSGAEFSLNVCFEEANDEFYGVSPIELERKLHELLETRQQERINELESALEYAVQEIEERERELCWWRETAHLVSRNLSGISGMFRQKKQGFHCTEPGFEVREIGKSLVENSMYDI